MMQRQAPREMVVGIFLSLGDLIGEQLEGGGMAMGGGWGEGLEKPRGAGGGRKHFGSTRGSTKTAKEKEHKTKSHTGQSHAPSEIGAVQARRERERERERERG